MKTTIFFIKIIGAGLIALCGFIMFICGLASNSCTIVDAFSGLAVMGFGGFLVAHVFENTEFPLQLGSAKPQAPKATSAPAIEAPATEPVQPTAE